MKASAATSIVVKGNASDEKSAAATVLAKSSAWIGSYIGP
jgi:hypothetical protein